MGIVARAFRDLSDPTKPAFPNADWVGRNMSGDEVKAFVGFYFETITRMNAEQLGLGPNMIGTMDVIKIERWSGLHNMGDNYFDHVAQVRIEGVTHTLWVAASGMLTMARPELFASDAGLAYFQERLGKLDASVLNGKLSGGPYVFKPGKKQGEPSNGEQHYDEYPRIVFTAGYSGARSRLEHRLHRKPRSRLDLAVRCTRHGCAPL